MAGLLDYAPNVGGLLAGPAPQTYGGLLGNVAEWWRSQPSILDQMRAIDAMRSRTGDPLADFRADANNPELRAAKTGMALNFALGGGIRSFRIPASGGRMTTVMVDPGYKDLANLLRRSKYDMVRGFKDPETGRIYAWDANDATHYYGIQESGFDPAKIPDDHLFYGGSEDLPTLARLLGVRGVPEDAP